MAIYSVHAHSAAPQPAEDARFLYEGFSWRAFFLGPFWLIWHGLLGALVLWTLAFVGLFLASVLALPGGASLTVLLLLQILLGLEANHLLERRWARQGYRLTSIIAAPAREEAEVAFCRQWSADEAGAPGRPGPQGRGPAGHREVLGSFPHPEARR